MNTAAQHVLLVLSDIVIAYGHSDEYSFVFHKSCSLFERRSAKLTSTVVSTFTAAYIQLWSQMFSIPPSSGSFLSQGDGNPALSTTAEDARVSTNLELNHLPTFDARCIAYPSNRNLRDYLSWRQADCHINNLYNTTFWALVLKGGLSNTEAEDHLKGTLSADKNEILWSRFGINYNNEREMFKKGSVVLREYKLVESGPRLDLNHDEDIQGIQGKELSKTQKEKLKKARQKAQIVVQHVDIINDDFWSKRPWLLSGQPGKPV